MIYVTNETAPSLAPAEVGPETSRQNASRVPPLAAPPSGKATQGHLQVAREEPGHLERIPAQMAQEAPTPNEYNIARPAESPTRIAQCQAARRTTAFP